MAKTRMMTQKGECYLCGKIGQTEEHHCLELLAVLAALSRMVKPSEITIKGSGYIRTGFQYLDTWKKSDWKKSNGKPVANEDLWQLVAEETKIHKITVFLI